MSNPFYHGNPVPLARFIGRRGELRRLSGRICNFGQSSAVVGDPRVGKSSILKYLESQQGNHEFFSQFPGVLFFSYLDAQTFDSTMTLIQFWEEALRPLKETKGFPAITQEYEVACQRNFDTYHLERLLNTMRMSNVRLVLLLDEFDLILHHPILNSGPFYGGLRSLSSRSEALSLMIAARQSLDVLNQATQPYSRTGSPFFNFMDEIPLGLFSDKDSESLLKQAGTRFKSQEREWVYLMAGGHPYLIQVAASALWEVYEDGERDMNIRQKRVADVLYREAAKTIESTWALWTPELKLAFTVIALNEIPDMIENRSFDVKAMLDKLADYTPELRQLEQNGYIKIAPNQPSGWIVCTRIFTLWLADELRRAVRDDISFDKWFSAQEWQGLLTKGEKDKIKEAAVNLTPVLKDGFNLFLKALITKTVS
jgi:hypothetical protein